MPPPPIPVDCYQLVKLYADQVRKRIRLLTFFHCCLPESLPVKWTPLSRLLLPLFKVEEVPGFICASMIMQLH